MANIFGNDSPTIYLSDGSQFALPMASRSGRSESFDKVIKSWFDLDKVYRERMEGFRLQCSYRWEKISQENIYSLIAVNNDTGILKLKFSSMPRLYPVRVSAFKHGLADGFATSDEAEIEFEGRHIIKEYPNPDLFYVMQPNLGRGAVVISLIEQ